VNGGSVQQGLSAAYNIFAFCLHSLAADKRYSLGLMKIIAHFLHLLWWFGAASLPVLISRYYQSYRQAIQCPTSSDCCTPGAEHLLNLELLVAFSPLTIWPLFLWHVVVQSWRMRVTQRRSNVAVLAAPPRP
jgi:hypothetical protein